MTAAADPAPPPPRRRAAPLLAGLALAVAGAAAGFALVRWDLLGGAEGDAARAEAPHIPDLAPTGFLPLPPIVANLPGGDRVLRFAGQLEVDPLHAAEVEALLPRVVDVLNGYLRAVTPAEVEDPAALLRMRAQMLRRAQVVAGGDRVRDLLVMEFVVN